MYTQFYGLSSAPFRITPDTRRFFGGGHRAAILDAMRYAIVAGEGIVKVTGEVGTGKTMLCRMLQETLPESVDLVYLANPGLSPQELFFAILHELGIQQESSTTPLEQQQLLQNFLIERHRSGKRVVVFVEEAQCMSEATLETLRLLSNLETRQDKLLQIVLFGQPELNSMLAQNSLRQLRDRITHSLELEPLNTDDVRDYVRFRLHSADYRGNELFTRNAYRLLAKASSGLIRRIHILADKALLAAYSDHSQQVTKNHLQLAIADSEFNSHNHWIFDSWAAIGLAATLATASLLTLHFKFTGNTQSLSADITNTHVADVIDSENLEELLLIQPAAGAPLVSSRLAATKDWLDHSTGNLTVQILLTDNDDVLVLEKLFEEPELSPLMEHIYIRETTVAGRRRWNVFYGEFSDSHSAKQAIAALPSVISAHKPYLRSLDNLRTTSQTHKD